MMTIVCPYWPENQINLYPQLNISDTRNLYSDFAYHSLQICYSHLISLLCCKIQGPVVCHECCSAMEGCVYWENWHNQLHGCFHLVLGCLKKKGLHCYIKEKIEILVKDQFCENCFFLLNCFTNKSGLL